MALGVGVVRTLGERGAELATRAGSLAIPAHQVEAVDTTAAGDCFMGVLAAAVDRGAALPDALRRAATAAALACTRHGSQGSLPFAAETDAMLAQAAGSISAPSIGHGFGRALAPVDKLVSIWRGCLARWPPLARGAAAPAY